MTDQVFSRSYLQGIPEMNRKRMINNIIEGFINELRAAASAGKTFYMYDPITSTQHRICSYPPPLPPPTTEELISAFQLKFPDCDVSYEEVWIETSPTKRTLKKGIRIDWS